MWPFNSRRGRLFKVHYDYDKGAYRLQRGSNNAAGFDLTACEDTPVAYTAIVPTGVHVEIPGHCFGLVIDRSSTPLKLGLHVVAGVVDSDYRGEIKVVVMAIGTPVEIKKGTKIAQLLILPIYNEYPYEVPQLTKTQRGGSWCGASDLPPGSHPLDDTRGY